MNSRWVSRRAEATGEELSNGRGILGVGHFREPLTPRARPVLPSTCLTLFLDGQATTGRSQLVGVSETQALPGAANAAWKDGQPTWPQKLPAHQALRPPAKLCCRAVPGGHRSALSMAAVPARGQQDRGGRLCLLLLLPGAGCLTGALFPWATSSPRLSCCETGLAKSLRLACGCDAPAQPRGLLGCQAKPACPVILCLLRLWADTCSDHVSGPGHQGPCPTVTSRDAPRPCE